MDETEEHTPYRNTDCGGTPSPPTLSDGPHYAPEWYSSPMRRRRSAGGADVQRSRPDEEVEFYEDDYYEDDRVETFYHSSPIGPAVSLYPRGYGGRLQSDLRQSRYPRLLLPPPHIDDYQVPSLLPHPTASRRFSRNIGYGAIIEPAPRRTSYREIDYIPLGGGSNYHPSNQHQQSEQHLHQERPPSMVEISPGIEVPLRSADDTRECILRNDIMDAACFACPKSLYCVQGASYVLCPDCRVVSPISHTEEEKLGDIGMGFTSETLNEVYNESFSSGYSH